MTPDEIKRLRSLAEAATPGPWKCDYEVYSGFTTADCKSCSIRTADVRTTGSCIDIVNQPKHPELAGGPKQVFANGRYIEACNPATILQLLDALEKANAKCERLLNSGSYSIFREALVAIATTPFVDSTGIGSPAKWSEWAKRRATEAVERGTVKFQGVVRL